MPPEVHLKPYPVTKSLSQFLNDQGSSTNRPLPLDDATTLALYGKQGVDPQLKKVVRCLKKPLELFPKIIHHAEFLVTIESDSGIVEQLHWTLTIEEARCVRSLHCVLDALGFIHQGLFNSKILLKGIEQFLNMMSNEDDFSSEQLDIDIETLKKLKQHLINLNNFLDSVLLHYSSFGINLSPTLIDNIKHAAKKIDKLISNLKSDRLMELMPHYKVTEEDVLCSVLGLNDELADMLKNLKPEIRKHKSDMYFLLCFLKERHEALNMENLHDRVEILKEMGFTENRSDVITKWIDKQPFAEHKSTLAWAEIYIEDLFKYDIFLNDRVPKFPFRANHLGQWFTEEVDRGEDENDSESLPQVSIINVCTEADAKKHINEKIAKFKEKNPEGKLYFHGTDHSGAKNILEDGIKLGRGKKCSDFSDGGGFYVADHSEYALDWAEKNKAAAVILFSINSDDLDRPNLDLRDDREKWSIVTKCFRSGEQHNLSKALKKEIRKSQYIIGPISGDGVPVNKKWRNKVQQICIRKEDMADVVGDPSSIVGIVFLNTDAAQLACRTGKR